MFQNRILIVALLLVLSVAVSVAAAQSTAAATTAVVPTLASFSGVLTDLDGKPLTSLTGVTLSLYKDSEGGAPLWMEVQNVQPDKTGHYTVTLGATTNEGLPASLFASGEARWLGVQPEGQAEQPRVMLLSVPYALKAADAETVGGLPPSAFMLAAPASAPNAPSVASSTAAVVTGSAPPAGGVTGTGTANFVPLWTTTSNIGNSVLFQSGSGSTAKIGINTSTPASTLDVKGGGTVRGLLSLPAAGTATATAGKNSQPLSLAASSFSSTTSKAVTQTFQWQAEPTGNNTATPAGTLNLLVGSGGSKAAETGLNIASNGQITFAPGQTFPGTGNGTITGVTAGTDLTGGGSSGNVALGLDTTKVPQLNAANTFTGNQSVTGTVTASGSVNGGVLNATSSFNFGGVPFGFGSLTTGNVFLGYAGNFTASNVGNTGVGYSALAALTTGVGNVAVGGGALLANTTGGSNTAIGWAALNTTTTSLSNTAIGTQALGYNGTGSYNTATGVDALIVNTTGSFGTAGGALSLYSNTTGTNNTAYGGDTLFYNTTGNFNTAVGSHALETNTTGAGDTAVGDQAGTPQDFTNTAGWNNTFVGFEANAGGVNEATLSNSTAIGAFAQVTENNALVLGGINGVNGATANTMVGIGTTAPTQSLEVDLGNALVRGPETFQQSGDNATLFLGDTNNFVQANFGVGLTFGVFENSSALTIVNGGLVGIGTATPDSLLTVNGSADKPGGGSWGSYSDARLKTLHGDFNSGLSQILKLHPIRYRYKEDNGMGIRDRDEHVGFVAQDVQRVIPEAVTENNKGYLLVNNDPILWTMLNAIKEQQREIATLRAQLRMHPSSTTKAAATRTASEKAKDKELRAVRWELTQLRNKDSRLEARLARLERTVGSLNAPANTVALASSATIREKK